MTTYRSIQITKKGSPEVLKLVPVELRAPVAGEVRVKTHYSGVGFTDVIMRVGYYPFAPKIPFPPGYEIVGEVDEVGSGVTGFKKGDIVVALTIWGGYAEYIYLDQSHLVHLPEGIDEKEALATVLNYATAYQMLHREAKVQAGQVVLFTGASGGVGTALLQLGKAAGLTMYGLCSPRKNELVTRNGGIPIDYNQANVAKEILAKHPQGIDASFDGIGGKYVGICAKVLKPKGKLILYGLTGTVKNGKNDNLAVLQTFATFGWNILMRGSKNAIFYGITVNYRKDKTSFKEDLPKIFELLRQGVIKPEIGQVLPLEEARQANIMLETGKAHGKLLLDCRA